MNEFNRYWTFLLTCLYYQVKPSQVTAKHPTKEISHVKKVVSYLLHSSGIPCRAVGDVLNIDHCTVHNHFTEIQARICKNDRIRNDIRNLTILTKQP